MWESRSDFQALWKEWEALFFGFPRFPHRIISTAFTPLPCGDVVAEPAVLAQTGAISPQTSRAATAHNTLRRNPPRSPIVPLSVAPTLHSERFARISISDCLVGRCDADAPLPDIAIPANAPDMAAPMERIARLASSSPELHADAARCTLAGMRRRLAVAAAGSLSVGLPFPV